MPNLSKHLNTAEVAHLLARPERTVQRQAATGVLPGSKLPGRTGSWVFDRAEIEALAKTSGGNAS